MNSKVGVLLILLVSGSFTGCLGPKGSEPTTTVPTLPTVPPLPELDLFQFQNCTVIVMGFFAPREVVALALPPGFSAWGTVPGMTNVVAVAQECANAVGPRSDLGPVSIFWTFAFVRTVNESWSLPGYIDYYVLDFVVSSQVVKEALAATNLSVGLSEVAVTKQAVPNGAQVWNWQVDADGFTATFGHRMNSEHPQESRHKALLWFGEGPYRRVIRNETGTVDTALNGGHMALTGASGFQRVMVDPVLAWKGESYIDASSVFSFGDEEY